MGMMVTYGNASGPVPPLDLLLVLSQKGSLFVTRPTLMNYTAKSRPIWWRWARSCSRWSVAGKCEVLRCNQRYALKRRRTAGAHRP